MNSLDLNYMAIAIQSAITFNMSQDDLGTVKRYNAITRQTLHDTIMITSSINF